MVGRTLVIKLAYVIHALKTKKKANIIKFGKLDSMEIATFSNLAMYAMSFALGI